MSSQLQNLRIQSKEQRQNKVVNNTNDIKHFLILLEASKYKIHFTTIHAIFPPSKIVKDSTLKIYFIDLNFNVRTLK